MLGEPRSGAGCASSFRWRLSAGPELRPAASLTVPSTFPSGDIRRERIPDGFLEGSGPRTPRLRDGLSHCSRAQQSADSEPRV